MFILFIMICSRCRMSVFLLVWLEFERDWLKKVGLNSVCVSVGVTCPLVSKVIEFELSSTNENLSVRLDMYYGTKMFRL